jgi:hypothetical protein
MKGQRAEDERDRSSDSSDSTADDCARRTVIRRADPRPNIPYEKSAADDGPVQQQVIGRRRRWTDSAERTAWRLKHNVAHVLFAFLAAATANATSDAPSNTAPNVFSAWLIDGVEPIPSVFAALPS